ncbi:MAG: hypothetical protein JST86_15075 [Bacteroidetes bacterium]|nr:hypothetical protein [Bacteroidota bacterium]
MLKRLLNIPILVAIFLSAVAYSGCSKNSGTASSTAHDFFTANLLNRDLAVVMAKDDTTDISADYVGYTFHLTDTSAVGGSIGAANLVRTIFGTWGTDAAYLNITFAFPSGSNSSLTFMNRQWQISTSNSTNITLTTTVGRNGTLVFKKL